MRTKIVAGNWKMHKTLTEGQSLSVEIVPMVEAEVNGPVKVVLCPPFIHLSSLRALIPAGKNIFLGAQNCASEASGAYTGEISAGMLQSVPVEYTIVGHSERREYFSETHAQLAKKVDLLLAHHITPIFCCGESLPIREAGQHLEVVKNQLSESLFHLSEEAILKITIAYEPIWAIGTGVTATTAQAQEMHAALRAHLSTQYGEKVAQEIPILYGGSVKPSNAAELFAQPDVDGGLVGGASLQSRDFVEIVKAVPF
ncbi:MAG: triose-phosphate isomerase [Microscillaceae bacterium]